jgi:hypothetical protein
VNQYEAPVEKNIFKLIEWIPLVVVSDALAKVEAVSCVGL